MQKITTPITRNIMKFNELYKDGLLEHWTPKKIKIFQDGCSVGITRNFIEHYFEVHTPEMIYKEIICCTRTHLYVTLHTPLEDKRANTLYIKQLKRLLNKYQRALLDEYIHEIKTYCIEE